jgi:hypothetical protein
MNRSFTTVVRHLAMALSVPVRDVAEWAVRRLRWL